MNQKSSSVMKFRQANFTIPTQSSKGGEIRQNGNMVQNLARKRNHNK
jgi:hypothetical protein